MSYRGGVSLNRSVFERLAAYCVEHDVSMSSLVQRLLEPVLAGVEPMPSRPLHEERNPPPPPRPAPDRSLLDRMAFNRALLARVREAKSEDALSTLVEVEVPQFLSDAIDDQISRARAAGREVSPGDVLDHAILVMLDDMSSKPWCRACLEALEDCRCTSSARSAGGCR